MSGLQNSCFLCSERILLQPFKVTLKEMCQHRKLKDEKYTRL